MSGITRKFQTLSTCDCQAGQKCQAGTAPGQTLKASSAKIHQHNIQESQPC